MKIKYCFFFLSFLCFNVVGQIAHATHFPTMHVYHILDDDDLIDNISFAYSLRLLRSDYNGPLIKLRRDSDNNEQDFYSDDNDIVDITAINTWSSGSIVYVTTWYDQTDLGRNAIQTNTNRQPILDVTDISKPYFYGEGNPTGTEDLLVVNTNTQLLTNAGKNASILAVLTATSHNNHSFGVRDNSDGNNRWLTHINWSNDNIFFEPGIGGGARNVNNLASENIIKQYSFIRRDDAASPTIDRRIIRNNSTPILDSDINNTDGLIGDFYFGIGASISSQINITSPTTYNTFSGSTTRFTEFIMYSEGKSDAFVQEIETNQISFWGL